MHVLEKSALVGLLILLSGFGGAFLTIQLGGVCQ